MLPFGVPRRADFRLAPDRVHLNHGGYGATPVIVLAEADRWRGIMESDPTSFFREALSPGLRQAAGCVATSFGGDPNDWVFVENATQGLNAIIASFPLRSNDEILCLSQVYGAIANTLEHHAGRAGARIRPIAVPLPFDDPAILIESVRRAIGPRTKLAVLDHVTSPAAIVIPVAAIAALCRANGIAVAVDGAHAPGMLSLDVPILGVDWYVGNLHKWGFAPKGCGILWCARSRQDALVPRVISHPAGGGFTTQFDYPGTRDNTAWLAAPAALAYLESLGTDRLQAHNRSLAQAAGDLLAESWRTDRATVSGAEAAMVAVRWPGPKLDGADRAAAHRLAQRLSAEHRMTVGVMALDGDLWIRVSAQIYNEMADYERLAAVGQAMRS